MSVAIVVPLEKIDVAKKKRQEAAVAARAPELEAEHGVEVTPIRETGHTVPRRLFEQLLVHELELAGSLADPTFEVLIPLGAFGFVPLHSPRANELARFDDTGHGVDEAPRTTVGARR